MASGLLTRTSCSGDNDYYDYIQTRRAFVDNRNQGDSSDNQEVGRIDRTQRTDSAHPLLPSQSIRILFECELKTIMETLSAPPLSVIVLTLSLLLS